MSAHEKTNKKKKTKKKKTNKQKNNKMVCTPSEDSDQPGNPPSLTRVFAMRSMGIKNPSFLRADSEDWSDWADAEADLSFR